MSVRRQRRRDRKTGAMVEFLIVDVEVMRPDGRTERKRKVAPVQTRRGAEQYERELRQAMLDEKLAKWKEVPKFKEWFEGRYWDEWVEGRKNKPSTAESKRSVFKHYLAPFFGHMRLDEIKLGEIARFRAELTHKGLSEKYMNNVLATLSKPLHYAVDVELIARAPKVGLFKVEPPEIIFWEFEE